MKLLSNILSTVRSRVRCRPSTCVCRFPSAEVPIAPIRVPFLGEDVDEFADAPRDEFPYQYKLLLTVQPLRPVATTFGVNVTSRALPIRFVLVIPNGRLLRESRAVGIGSTLRRILIPVALLWFLLLR